jgi:hypothetical protein
MAILTGNTILDIIILVIIGIVIIMVLSWLLGHAIVIRLIDPIMEAYGFGFGFGNPPIHLTADNNPFPLFSLQSLQR